MVLPAKDKFKAANTDTGVSADGSVRLRMGIRNFHGEAQSRNRIHLGTQLLKKYPQSIRA